MGLILMKILQSCRACCCIVVIRPRVPTYCQQINCDMARGVQHSGFSQPTPPHSSLPLRTCHLSHTPPSSGFVLAICLNCQQFKTKLVKCALNVSQRKHRHHPHHHHHNHQSYKVGHVLSDPDSPTSLVLIQ